MEDLLIPRGKTTEQVTQLVVIFHADLSHLTYVLHNHRCASDTSQSLKGGLPNPFVAYCHPPILTDLVASVNVYLQSMCPYKNRHCIPKHYKWQEVLC